MKRLFFILVVILLVPVTSAMAIVGNENAARLRSEVVRAGVWANTDSGTPPLYIVKSNSCRSSVQGSGPNADALTPQWVGAPLPCGFKPSEGTDREAVIYNQTGDGGPDYYEFWDTRYADPRYPSGWSASYGGSIKWSQFGSYHLGNLVWPNRFGVQASGYAFTPGIITVSDLQRGWINHVVHLLVPYSCPTWHWPATRTDAAMRGTTPKANCIEYGTIFRLPGSMNLDTLGLSPVARMVAYAARDYGLAVSDATNSAVGFRFENWKRPGASWSPDGRELNPYKGYTADRTIIGPNYFGCDGKQNGSVVDPWWNESDCWPAAYGVFKNFPWNALYVSN